MTCERAVGEVAEDNFDSFFCRQDGKPAAILGLSVLVCLTEANLVLAVRSFTTHEHSEIVDRLNAFLDSEVQKYELELVGTCCSTGHRVPPRDGLEPVKQSWPAALGARRRGTSLQEVDAAK
jgi:hypothetical protein